VYPGDVEVPAGHRARLGRFVLGEVLGRGAAGVVHAAVDPTLDRPVAIKLLHATGDDQRLAAGRLLREARALARVTHPNVVTIHETGVEDGQVYVVMELVAGTTARQWRDAAPRTEAEILDVYRQAARGLAAAHAAGLVHRDVKPENILVGADGRVRVTDFGLVAAFTAEAGRDDAELGLAATSATVAATAAADDDAADRIDVLTLTRTGMLIGTPAYMAPEGHLRGPLDARSDQFGLCVALWEALTGARPFPATGYHALARAVLAGQIVGGDALPPRLRAVLRRGLAVDPAARWPSLEALVAALDADPITIATTTAPPARRRPVVAMVGALAVGVGAIGWWAPWTSPRPASDIRTTAVAPTVAAAPPPRAPAPVQLTAPGGCPTNPTFIGERTLVFDDAGPGGNDLFKLDLGGRPERLVSTTGLDWRAGRGRRPGEAAFVSMQDGVDVAAFVDVDTGAVERTSLRTNTAVATATGLIYARDDNTELRRLRDGRDEPLGTFPDGRLNYVFEATAAGDRLAIIAGGERSALALCLLDIGDGTPMTCVDRPVVLPARPSFSPDGARVYVATPAGVVALERDGRTTPIVPGVIANSGVAVSPDGRRLAYGDCDALAEVRAVGTDALVFRAPMHDPALGPGDAIVYARDPDAASRVLTLRSADGSERDLTTAALGWVGLPAFDPGGRHVAFKVEGAAPGIYVVETTPFPPEPVTTRASDTSPVWLGDGRLAFNRWASDGRPQVMIIDPAEGTAGDDARRPAHPRARIIADRVAATGELILRGPEATRVYLWDPTTGREREIDLSAVPLPPSEMAPVATPDGRWLITAHGPWANEVWRVPIPQGPRDRRVASRLVSFDGRNSGLRPMVRADGTVLYTRLAWSGNLWLTEL